jgi:hypothetical protein
MYLFQTGNGRLELVNNLTKEWERMLTGEQYFVQYRLDFPVRFPLPAVKSIVVNNQQICRGGKPSVQILFRFYSLPICYSQTE